MKIHFISALPLLVCLIIGLRGVIGGWGALESAEQAGQGFGHRNPEMNVELDKRGDPAKWGRLAQTADDLSFSELVER